MKAILNEVGITSILVTHDQEEAFDIADHVAVFNRYAVVGCVGSGNGDRGMRWPFPYASCREHRSLHGCLAGHQVTCMQLPCSWHRAGHIL